MSIEGDARAVISGERSALPAKVLLVNHHLVWVKALATLATLDLKSEKRK